MAERTGYVMIVIAAPVEIAAALARAAITAAVAACAQVTRPVTSIYTWEGAVHEEEEALIFLKTRADKIETVKKLVAEKHHYKVPEVIVLPITDGNEAYFAWIDETLGPAEASGG